MNDITKMPDIFEREIYYTVDYYNLNQFISKIYNLPNFEGTLESANDSTHEFRVNSVIDEWHEKDMEEILDRGNCEHYSLGTVLNDLCVKGLIDHGNYLVNVSW